MPVFWWMRLDLVFLVGRSASSGMFWHVSPWVYLVWDSLSFLDLIKDFLSHIREVFNYNLFKYFLSLFLFLFYFWDPYIRMLVCLMLSQRCLRLSSILFILFSLFCSVVVFPLFYLPGCLSILLLQLFCYCFLPENF